MIDAADLPNDVDALKAQALALMAEVSAKNQQARSQAKSLEALEAENTALTKQLAEQTGQIAHLEDLNASLEALVAAMRQAMFGRKSEKICDDQLQLALEDLETTEAVVIAEIEEDVLNDRPRPKRKINRGALPKHLARIEQVIEPEDMICPCGAERHVIGEDVTERLDVIPAKFQIIVTRRPKYACRSCEESILQAPAPAHIITGGLPTERTIASVIVSKYADHVPLYRQAQIYAREGIKLDRSTLADWVGRAAFELRPVYEAMLQDLKSSNKLFMDETIAPVLEPGKGKTRQGYFWALARDDRAWQGTGPPGVCFTYAPGRSGKYAEDILDGFEGVMQVDGYAGYNRLLKPNAPNIQLAYCWAHARRKLYELTLGSTPAPIAQDGLQQIADLYRIEKTIRGQTAEQRLAERQEKSAPLIDAFKIWLDQARAQVSAKSPTGAALKYIARYWEGLILFLGDGRIEMDNNPVERTIRPIALNRKNALFAGHETGAQNWAMLASLIETCKLGRINPHQYLDRTLKAIANGHKQTEIDQLLPWNFKQD